MSPSTRLMRAPVLVTATLLVTSCASLFPSVPALTLASELEQARAGARRARDIRLVMARDVEALERLSDLALDGARDALGDGAPRALFKLTAVSCLNEDASSAGEGAADVPADAPDASSPNAWLAVRYGARITCAPISLEPLARALEAMPKDRAGALAMRLQHVDEARGLRDTLRLRLVKLPDLVAQSREALALERAALRRAVTQSDAQRGEFGEQEWATSRANLERWRLALEKWEEDVDALDAAYPAWPPRLDADLRQLYIDLAEL